VKGVVGYYFIEAFIVCSPNDGKKSSGREESVSANIGAGLCCINNKLRYLEELTLIIVPVVQSHMVSLPSVSAAEKASN
jgi:hypothetical protein